VRQKCSNYLGLYRVVLRGSETNQTVWTQMVMNSCMLLRDQTPSLFCAPSRTLQTFRSKGREGYNFIVIVRLTDLESLSKHSCNNYEKDIIPPIYSDYDCCNFVRKDVKGYSFRITTEKYSEPFG